MARQFFFFAGQIHFGLPFSIFDLPQIYDKKCAIFTFLVAITLLDHAKRKETNLQYAVHKVRQNVQIKSKV